MKFVYLKAPFAVFRSFQTGSFRPTADFITHSAAYGLLLNLAGIESRRDDGKSPMTLMRDDLPPVKLSLGTVVQNDQIGNLVPKFPTKATAFQQLHNYPVGTSGKEHAPATKGNKYNITPVRREFLVNLEAVIGIDADTSFLQRLECGLLGDLDEPRYGLPFLGDNAFLPDRITLLDEVAPVFWLNRVSDSEQITHGGRVLRLTQWIDRAESSQTISHLYVPSSEPTSQVPEEAWQWLPRNPNS
ncbi:type I-MYXAN CRISPR-associated protein Cas5/Cmx5/DevS [bacterium]|nr:type I-MYXAN CRISPR-associated protein Cas5/Cmx5/DevS [bacterium]